MSRVIIVLPTSNEAVDAFEQTITRGFSLVNTRILLPSRINEEKKPEDEEFQKDYNYKICYNIRLNNEKEYSNKTVITKILKLHENNQDDFGMTKPLPTGCIKQNFDMSWGTFNLLLQNVSLDDQISNLYVVHIEFDHAKATEKQLVYNEIYPPIIEKQKIIDPCEKSVYQLLEQNSSTEK